MRPLATTWFGKYRGSTAPRRSCHRRTACLPRWRSPILSSCSLCNISTGSVVTRTQFRGRSFQDTYDWREAILRCYQDYRAPDRAATAVFPPGCFHQGMPLPLRKGWPCCPTQIDMTVITRLLRPIPPDARSSSLARGDAQGLPTNPRSCKPACAAVRGQARTLA